jgi:hypothetical protein
MPDHHKMRDRFRLVAAREILETVTLPTIRAKSLANLERWRENGVWVPAYAEWHTLMVHGSDADVIAAMTGSDEKSSWLRKSPPYPGLITQERRHELLESFGFFSEHSELP